MTEKHWAAAALAARSVSGELVGGTLADVAASAAIESAHRLASALTVETPLPLHLTMDRSCDEC
ncbi:hypothetical protein CH302_18320 [Rhodococcus sp. 15-2388-1-1a]|uniref:hypothetical protein n=1 Tax=Nocardiaceae TaxID=85025 RepID=UPI00056D3A93|nr:MULTISPECIES: hypothetical protein [Rhodococcus]OZE94934.1 hypothetical protein CH302_18320 [Rhodococcus sp. 15-2388-1-1a]